MASMSVALPADRGIVTTCDCVSLRAVTRPMPSYCVVVTSAACSSLATYCWVAASKNAVVVVTTGVVSLMSRHAAS